MQTNVLEYLEHSAQRLPDKVAFADPHTQLTFREVYDRARGIGSSLVQRGAAREPVIVYMSKSPDTLAAFWGVIYAGCYYVPIDEEMPRRRIELILESTQAKYLLYDASTKDKLEELHFAGEVLAYEGRAGHRPMRPHFRISVRRRLMWIQSMWCSPRARRGCRRV
jgi:acyl-CoA synthetase (AMP-forming)/AMP-acid ligase II